MEYFLFYFSFSLLEDSTLVSAHSDELVIQTIQTIVCSYVPSKQDHFQ